MGTEKLYYEDAYLTNFPAMVLGCEEQGENWIVELDRTAFFPEGGGQPADHGYLGGVRVLDVQEKDGIILHKTDGELPLGAALVGRVDWARRFDLMQQHSGEHVVSGLIHAAYGYDNVGFHMGADVITVDLSGELDFAALKEIERRANEKVWENLETEITWPSVGELLSMDFRSKKELTGAIRIVTFPGCDVCACCGTHVRRTGEIGSILILSCEKFHEGVRLEMVCGGRAIQYANSILDQNHEVSTLMSAKVQETAAAVRRLCTENAGLKARTASLEGRVFAGLAEKLTGMGNALVFEDGLNPDGVRRLTDAGMKACGGRCAVFSGSDETGYAYAVGQTGGDLRDFVKELNTALNGRGGGKPFFAQGSVKAARAQIEAFFEQH